jgi:tRNA (guanine37-N1)-methyltransferase
MMTPKIKTGLIKTTDKADKMNDSDREIAQKAAGSVSDCPKPLWQATVLTLFPEMFPGPLGHSLAGKSLNDRIWTLKTLDIREFARDKHRTVDDAPLGGGVGMVLKPDVIAAALSAAASSVGPRIYLSPRGRLLDQALVRELAAAPGAVFLCGRYEGVDQRVIDAADMMEISIGDYVLSGGEVAALTVMDAVVRLLPGVMGKEAGHLEESFETGLLEHSHYTQPRLWNGIEAPAILASGHHRKIAEWRQAEAEKETQTRRPDMWQRYLARQQLQKGKT